MGRNKWRVKPGRGGGLTLTLPNKRDTPVKTALSRRDNGRRLLPNKRYESFPEEPEVNVLTVKPTDPPLVGILAGITPVHCKSVLHLSSPAFSDNPRGQAAASPDASANTKMNGCQVPPAGRPTIHEAFKGGEMRVKEEEQNLAVTPENSTSSSTESGTTFSSDDDEEDCYSSASTTSSSLPSPEIFRKESYVETLTFPIKEELLGLHLHIKNSTLLDVSHAESIHTHLPPNLSTIIDASAIVPEKNCEINTHRGPEAETKMHTHSLKSDKAFKWKPPPKVANRRPLLCKKKVWFKSPVIAEPFEAKRIPATKSAIHNSSGPVQSASPAVHVKPDADTSRAGLINSDEEALRQTVTVGRPVKSSPERASFFDFASDSDRNAFFQRMRERCVQLRSAPLFPLTAVEHREPSAL